LTLLPIPNVKSRELPRWSRIVFKISGLVSDIAVGVEDEKAGAASDLASFRRRTPLLDDIGTATGLQGLHEGCRTGAILCRVLTRLFPERGDARRKANHIEGVARPQRLEKLQVSSIDLAIGKPV